MVLCETKQNGTLRSGTLQNGGKVPEGELNGDEVMRRHSFTLF